MDGMLTVKETVWTVPANVSRFMLPSAPAVVGSRIAVELAITFPEVVTFQTPTTRCAAAVVPLVEPFVRTWNVQLPAGIVTLPAPSTIQPLLFGVDVSEAASVGGVRLVELPGAGSIPGEESR